MEGEDFSWCEDYFLRDESVPKRERSPKRQIVLPILEGSRSPSPKRAPMRRVPALNAANLYRFSELTGRMHFFPPSACQHLPNIDLSDKILRAIESMVPGCQGRGPLRDGARAEVERVLEMASDATLPAISYSLTHIPEPDDDRMLQKWDLQRSTTNLTYYMGITEQPTRRLREHAAWPPKGRMPRAMHIVRVAPDSGLTAAWERKAIAYCGYKGIPCLNDAPGGEGASDGQPHYGYILKCA